MCLEALSDDAVLDGDVSDIRSRDAEGFVAAPSYTHVVEDHVTSFGDGDSVFPTGPALSHSNPNISHNSIVGIAETPAIVVDGDAVAGRGLPEDRDAFGDDHALFDRDETADGKDDYAVGLRACVTQGARARVFEVGDNVDGAATATGCVGSEAFSTWESKPRGSGIQKRNDPGEMMLKML